MNESFPSPDSVPAEGGVFVTGGTGFVGTAIRGVLADRPVRLLVRDSERSRRKSRGADTITGDVTDPESLRGAMDGCSTVVHLAAVIAEEGGATFDGVIRRGTENVLAEAARAGVTRFMHMNALGTRNDPRYAYYLAKWQAEEAVRAAAIPATIFRPSVMFGPGDEFFTTLARLIRLAPVIPIVGNGKSRFQPVAVDEVARAFVVALSAAGAVGRTYELGGGKVYTYEEMVDLIAARLNKRKRKVHLPVGLMKTVVRLARPLPAALRPPVTTEQLNMLEIDNSTEQSATRELIGVSPLALEDGIDYLASANR